MKNENYKLFLAPMAGITDLPFRLICKEFGADIVYSEMISVTGLFYNSEKTKELLQTVPEEQPIVFQLFGSNPEHFAKAARFINHLADQLNNQSTGIDLNFGCPVRKVNKQGAGCVLMKDGELSRKIIQAVLENTTLPVSIKIRSGIGEFDAIQFLKYISDLAWKTAIVHGRTFEKGFSGPIDFEIIRKIKTILPDKIIIANGGIKTPENAKEALEKTGADGLAIATGALGKPWLFRQIKDYLETNKYELPDLKEIKKTVLRHVEYHQKFKGENFTEFRKHLGWYFKGLPGAKEIRRKLFEVENYNDVNEVINKIK